MFDLKHSLSICKERVDTLML